MRILITTSRLPFALGLIRKLAASGHEVHTSDAFAVAPGSHSRWLSGNTTTAPPAQEPERFIADVADIEGYCGVWTTGSRRLPCAKSGPFALRGPRALGRSTRSAGGA